jgi:hypothetical protein
MKNNNITNNKYGKEMNNSNEKDYINKNVDNNDLNNNDIQNIKLSLNKLRNISSILKEKNIIIDSMLLSTKKRKKILSQEILEKEAELLKIENEINIYYNKLFSDLVNTDANKSVILSKIKLIREELIQKKYVDYLNKKIMVEQKEEKIQQGLSKLSTEQLENFNNEIYNDQTCEDKDKDKANIEILKKHYEDIKKSDIYQKVFSEIKESLYNPSMSSLYNNKNSIKKFNSKMINESSNYFQPYSMQNSEKKSNLFSNKNKKYKGNHSMDNKYTNSNDNYFKNENSNLNSQQKFLFDIKSCRNNSYAAKNYINKKKKRFNSKLFMLNQ